MSDMSRRHMLREKEVRSILQEISRKIKTEDKQLFESIKQIETIELADAKAYLINGKPLLASINEKLIPTLFFEESLSFLPRIVVDMGAIPYICNGADVMAPGVVHIEGQFNAEDLILVVDVQHNKPLAIGTTLMDSRTMEQTKHGRIVKILHYVGDKFWTALRNQFKNL